MNFIWDDIFETQELDGKSDAQLCASALNAWAICEMGETHKNFDEVMAKIGVRLHITATPENLSTWAREQGFSKGE